MQNKPRTIKSLGRKYGFLRKSIVYLDILEEIKNLQGIKDVDEGRAKHSLHLSIRFPQFVIFS